MQSFPIRENSIGSVFIEIKRLRQKKGWFFTSNQGRISPIEGKLFEIVGKIYAKQKH